MLIIQLTGIFLFTFLLITGKFQEQIEDLNPDNPLGKRFVSSVTLITMFVFCVYLWWLPIAIKLVKKVDLSFVKEGGVWVH